MFNRKYFENLRSLFEILSHIFPNIPVSLDHRSKKISQNYDREFLAATVRITRHRELRITTQEKPISSNKFIKW